MTVHEEHVAAARAELQRAGSTLWRAAGEHGQPFIIAAWQAMALVADLVAKGHERTAANDAVRAEFRIYDP